MGGGREVGGEAAEGMGSWLVFWAVEQEKPWALGPFLSLAFCRGTSVGQLHLLLVALEQVLARVHDTEGLEYLLLQPPAFQEFLTGTSAGETAVTGSGRSRHI